MVFLEYRSVFFSKRSFIFFEGGKLGLFHLECFSKGLLAQDFSKPSIFGVWCRKFNVFCLRKFHKTFDDRQTRRFFIRMPLKGWYCLSIPETIKNCSFLGRKKSFFKEKATNRGRFLKECVSNGKFAWDFSKLSKFEFFGEIVWFFPKIFDFFFEFNNIGQSFLQCVSKVKIA